MDASPPPPLPDADGLARRFEENRARLRAVARRMLGSAAEAEDAVQETWLRLSRSEAAEIANLGGWLTTVTARICLDVLRARRPEEPLDAAEGDAGPAAPGGAEEEVFLAEALGPALTIVLERLPPAERVAFVLHDLFAVPFDEVAGILNRSPEAARQLASRARRRVQDRGEGRPESGREGPRGWVDAFLKASREGDFEGLLAVLAPGATLRADALAVRTAAANAASGAPALAPEVRGAEKVAQAFRGRAPGARRARIDGLPGAVWAPGGEVRVAFVFAFAEDGIRDIEMVMEPARVRAMEIALLE